MLRIHTNVWSREIIDDKIIDRKLEEEEQEKKERLKRQDKCTNFYILHYTGKFITSIYTQFEFFVLSFL